MDKGSHMVGGRTYRNILTTNEQKPTGPVEPQKLGVITTAIIPEKTKPDPEPKGTDLGKMITTHDERDIEDMGKDNTGAEAQTPGIPGTEDVEPVPTPSHKKSGRPKKAE